MSWFPVSCTLNSHHHASLSIDIQISFVRYLVNVFFFCNPRYHKFFTELISGKGEFINHIRHLPKLRIDARNYNWII